MTATPRQEPSIRLAAPGRSVQPKDLRTEEETRGDDAPSRITIKPDDDVIATSLANQLRNQIAFFHRTWKFYEAGYWQQKDGAELRRLIRRALRGWRKSGIAVSQNRIKSLAAMLEDDLNKDDQQIMERQRDQRRWINLKNGMFNLDTMEFVPEHDPGLFFTTQLDFEYDIDADCPNFLRFMNSSLVLPDTTSPDRALITLVMEALGYSFTARTDMKASFWLVGQKDSGKSTFIAMLKSLLGALHTTIDLNQLETNRFILAPMIGKRVVTFTEASSSTMLPDALYKTIVGGQDEVQVDVKNRDPITFRPEAKIWWAMNEMPRVSDRSGATTRRIIMIPYNRTIPERDRIGDLEYRLERERPGIFNMAMAGYQRMVMRGTFAPCDQSEALRQQYISENDTEATFVEDCCDQHESYRVRSSELYQAYKDWCETFGFRPRNMNQIAGEWRRLGFTSSKSDGVMVWRGLRMRPPK